MFAQGADQTAEPGRDRVISIVLSEEEWQAFVRTHPQPVRWIREKIQESIGFGATAGSLPSAPGAASTTSATTRSGRAC
jgi:hypothetical protein